MARAAWEPREDDARSVGVPSARRFWHASASSAGVGRLWRGYAGVVQTCTTSSRVVESFELVLPRGKPQVRESRRLLTLRLVLSRDVAGLGLHHQQCNFLTLYTSRYAPGTQTIFHEELSSSGLLEDGKKVQPSISRTTENATAEGDFSETVVA
ncbi:hypothetical protein Taro_023459 [Colocasia esculenta]|uniref:Uncharacterized protein n=1 Tax=Colocasia esculenta TaxID=4460 RepID=A0A843V492_COLES|nr:hypothetical protein [Colocasia esculenta]